MYTIIIIIKNYYIWSVRKKFLYVRKNSDMSGKIFVRSEKSWYVQKIFLYVRENCDMFFYTI
jgi:hypothetical protein